MKIAEWRNIKKGKTSKKDFQKLINYLKPKKTDVFYDLGCYNGDTCNWISPYVKSAVGVENHKGIYELAIKNTLSSKFPNVKIIYSDYEKISLNDATLIYCTFGFSIPFLGKIKKIVKPGARLIVSEIPPPYPIKSKKIWPFHVFRFPLERVKGEEEYAKNCIDGKDVTIQDMFDWLKRENAYEDIKNLKWYLSHGESNWKKLQT